MKTLAPALTPVQRKFILHWGEMGARWGINRTVAQIFALLYLSPRPMTAEELANTLSVARSNVSQSMHELLSWRLVRASSQIGDRRDYYEAVKDVWDLSRIVLEERKRREIDPTRAVLLECQAELAHSHHAGDRYTKERLAELKEFLDDTDSWYDKVRALPTGALRRLFKLGGQVEKLLGLGKAG